MNYGESLREQRISRNLSLMDIEKATGISNGSVCRWEKGQVIPSIDFCVKLAQFYGISIDELVGFSNEINSSNEKALSEQPKKSLSTFDNEFKDILSDNNFVQMAKLFKAAKPELRALALGYLVGLFQSNGINTKSILGY